MFTFKHPLKNLMQIHAFMICVIKVVKGIFCESQLEAAVNYF